MSNTPKNNFLPLGFAAIYLLIKPTRHLLRQAKDIFL